MNDRDVIAILQSTGHEGPQPQRSAEATLAAGRRAVARRRYAFAGSALLSVAALGLVSLNLPFGNESVVVSAVDPAARGAGGTDHAGPVDKPGPLTMDEVHAAELRNTEILQAAMGPDFVITTAGGGTGELRPGSPSSAGLPDSYLATIEIVAGEVTDNAMPQLCKAMNEKGGVFEGCVDHKLPNDQIVQAHFGRWAPTPAIPQATAGESVRVLFRQAGGVLVWVDLVTSVNADKLTPARSAAARAWLESMLDRVGAAVTDPKIESPGAGFQADADPDPDPDPDR